jgi:hypothetical protein
MYAHIFRGFSYLGLNARKAMFDFNLKGYIVNIMRSNIPPPLYMQYGS